MSTDLPAFLRARYAETTAKAEAAREGGEGRWRQDDAKRHPGRIEDERVEPVVYDEGSPSEAQAAHIAENDPARVLADIEAKRQIVDRYAWLREHGDTGGTAWVLPLLALPYADHPDYRPEWRPEP